MAEINKSKYLGRSDVPAKGRWGVPDPAGTARGRLAQFRRGLVGRGVAQSGPEFWAMNAQPGQETKAISDAILKQKTQRAASIAAAQKRGIAHQTTPGRFNNILLDTVHSNVLGPIPWNEYQESNRLAQIGVAEKQIGMSMDRLLNPPELSGAMNFVRSSMTPAKELEYDQIMQQKMNVVNQAIWKMALMNAAGEYTDIGSLTGVEYDMNQDSPTYGRPILDTKEKVDAYNSAIAAASRNPDSHAIEKYGVLQSYFYAWNMANGAEDLATVSDLAGLGVSTTSEEGKAAISSYKNYIIDSMKWEGIPNNIINMAFSTESPMAFTSMVDFGFIKVGKTYSAAWLQVFGYKLPDNIVSGTVIKNSDGSYGIEYQYGEPAPEVKGTDNTSVIADAAAAGLGIPGVGAPTGTPVSTEVPETSVSRPTSGSFISNGEEFRSRDWSKDQVLTANEAANYFDIEGEIPTGATFTVRMVDGTPTMVSRTIEGWTTNFGEDGVNTWVSPEGEVFNSQAEVDEHIRLETEQASSAFIQGGNAGAVFNEFRPSSPWRDPNTTVYYPTGNELIPDTLANAGFKEGMALVSIGTPLWQDNLNNISLPTAPIVGSGGSQWEQAVTPHMLPSQPTFSLTPASGKNEYGTYESINPIVVNGSTIGIEIVSNGIDGNTNAGDTLATYYASPEFDDANLPSFIVKSGNGYTVDISQDSGKVFLMSYYPDQFLRLIWSQGQTPANEKFLQEDYGMTDQEISDWFKGKPYGFKDPGPSEFQNFTGKMLSLLQLPNELFADAGAAIFSIGGDEADRNDIQQIHDFLQTGGVGLLAAAAPPLGIGASIASKTQSALSATSLMGTPSGAEGWESIYTPIQVAAKYLYAQASDKSVEDRVFLQNLASSIEEKGFGAFFNVRTREALGNYDVPGWVDALAFTAEILVPIGGFGKLGRMPSMLKSVRTGTFSFIKSIRTVEDFIAAASFNGWRVQRSIKGRFILFIKDASGKERAIPIKNLTEADSFFKYGTPYKLRPARMRAIEKALLLPIKRIQNWTDFVELAKVNKWGVRFAVTGIDKAVSNTARKVFVKIDKELIEINSIEEANNLIRNRAIREHVATIGRDNIRITIDGREIPLYTMPTEAEVLIDVLKNQPGRLGLGLLKLFEAKIRGKAGPRLTIEDIKKMADPELQGIARELIQEGKVALDTIYRASNIIKIRCEEAAREMSDWLKSQLNTKEIDKLLRLDSSGDILAGQVSLIANIPEELTIRVGKSGLYAAHDVAEYWKYFTFTNPAIPRWFSNIDELLKGLEELGLQEGVINKAFRRYRALEAKGIYRSYFPRTIVGQEDMAEVILKNEEDFLKKRAYMDAVEGRDLGIHYGTLGQSIDAYIDSFYNKLVMKRARGFIIRSGLTIPKIWETAEGLTLMQTARATAKRAGQVKIIDKVIRHIYGPAGKEIPAGGRMAWINETFPELSDRIKKLVYYSSDNARRDILHSLQNRMRIRKLILQNEIRNIKVASKAERTEIIGELYDDTVKLRNAEDRIQIILDQLSNGGILQHADASYLEWLAGWTQKSYPGTFRWYKNWDATPGASHLVTLKGFYDDVVDLRKSLADEIDWFNGMTDVQRAARLSNPLQVMASLEEANSILNKIWRIDKPGQTIQQLRKLLDGVFPGEFTGRLDDLSSIIDKSKVKSIYESLEADVQKLLDDTEKAKVTAAMDRKAAEDASAVGANTNRFESEGRTGATFDRVFGEIKVNGKIISGKAVRLKIEKIYTDKANPIISAFSQFTQAMLPLQLAMDFSFATIQGAPVLGLEAILNLKALVNGGSPSFIWAEAMKYSIGQTFSGMFSKSMMKSFRNKHVDVYDRKLGKGLLVNDQSDYFKSVGWIGKNIEKISNANIRKPFEWAIAPYAGFQSGFSAWSEVSRVLLIEKLESSWYLGGGTEMELARFANAITGSSLEPGRSAAQRVSESALFLAPRFYRANLFVLNRMSPIHFRTGGARGMTGKMMGESILGMYASFNAAYIALCYAVGQSPKLNPLPKSMGGDGSEAYTIEVDGQMIGIPGLWFSGPRTLMSAAAIGLANPDKIFSIDWDNLKESSVGTLLSFATDRQSLALSFIQELATGKAYGGIRLEDSNDYLKTIGEQFIPIAWRSLVEGDNKPSTYYAWGANILGFRNWQQNAWTDYYEAFDEFLSGVSDSYLTAEQLSKRDSGKLTSNDLMSWQVDKILLENPELKGLYDIAKEAQIKRETDRERAYRLDREQYDTSATNATSLACADLRNTSGGLIQNMKQCSDRINEISAERSVLNGDLRRRYPELFASFDEQFLADKENAPQFEIAMNEYYDNVVNGAGNTDKYGNFVMENYIQAKADWIEKWGPEFYSYLLEVKRYGLMGQDPIVLKMWEAKEFLGPYWSVAEADREDFLTDPANVEYDANLIFMGYTSVIHNPAAEELVRQWCTDLNLDADKVIPALTKLQIPDIILQKFDGLKANDRRDWSELPTSGYARARFLIEHPSFKAYATSTEEIDGERIGWLNGFNEAGEDLYTWDKVPTVAQEALLNEYDLVEGKVPKQIWRCTYPAGDSALSKFRGMTRMDSEVCSVLLAQPISGAQTGANTFVR